MARSSGKPKFEEIIYLFQGGGALGAFQVGAYQALTEAGFAPDWIAGISIGAINSAIIAGNPPETRIDKLYHFWNAITHKIDPQWSFSGLRDHNLIQAYNTCSAFATLMFGQQNFFNVRGLNPWLLTKTTPDEISFYDTSALCETLHEVIDFKYLKKSPVRLSLGAVNVQSGKLEFFDNHKQSIGVEHVMASCALPPAFPAIKIGKNYYWDGGLYSNTPLICVINDVSPKKRLCFLVDLFESTGLLPQNMDEVLERAKDINYAGHIDIMLNYVHELAKYNKAHDIHITKIVYKANPHDVFYKDHEFSNFNAKRRLVDGYMHTKKLLAQPNWWEQD